MEYKIAVGSSDGVHIDLKFGEVKEFLIYEVSDEIKLVEKRKVQSDNLDSTDKNNNCDTSGCNNGGCGRQEAGCGGSGTGCSGPEEVISKVSLIADCRCVVCKKIGFQAQKQFEKKAISVFDVDCEVKEALDKITFYYGKIDNHEAYRK